MSPDQVSIAIAFAAGLLSILSPCTLALIPAYVSYLSGAALSPGDTRTRVNSKVMVTSFLFVLGFTILFILYGASATLLGRVLLQNQVVVRRAAGILVILFGLHQLGIFRFSFLDTERRIQFRGQSGNPVHALFIGMAFGAGWTPCVGPILGSILVLAGTTQSLWGGVGLLLTYSAGMALPFLVIAALIGRFPRISPKLSRHAHKIEIASGILLVVIGIMLFTNYFQRLAGYFSYWQFLQ